ncbi:28 kDa heat- and acid-stable phosphoprotein-like [Drosophila madeirensis]|uniref:28 kDa heat- and acid-stable phosphoprotein-like n=1 Tax=Drosophila madeirensis TaxID=30013 RepID=A0AAU9FX03_DROMD
MPRQKQVTHKGKSREFTPVEEMQQDWEEHLKETSLSSDEDESSSDDDSHGQHGKTLRPKGVQSLIEISNPNRSKSANAWKDEICDDPLVVSPPKPGRRREMRRSPNIKLSGAIQADLDRLAVIRKERQQAAQRRFDTKKGDRDRSSSKSSNGGSRYLKKSSHDRGAYLQNSAGPQKPNRKSVLKKK